MVIFQGLQPAPPRHNFPYVSLLVVGAISIFCGFFNLDLVIQILIAMRILVQFIGQLAAVALLRKNSPQLHRPYRIWLYPLPSLLALVGWLFIYITLDKAIKLYSLGALLLGVLCFLVWSSWTSRWPFQKSRCQQRLGATAIPNGQFRDNTRRAMAARDAPTSRQLLRLQHLYASAKCVTKWHIHCSINTCRKRGGFVKTY